MKTNIDYWRDVYTDCKVPVFPSQFSIFVQSWLGENSCNIVEFGCGNGRDSILFSNLGHNVLATDQCIGSDLKKMGENSDTLKCIESDVVSIAESLSEHIDTSRQTVVYSRFFQHAIDEKTQTDMLEALARSLPDDAKLFFEFRLQEDKDTEKVFGIHHFRRFQSDSDFLTALDRSGYDCDYHCKGQGYAVFGTEDPVVGRFVAIPKGRHGLYAV